MFWVKGLGIRGVWIWRFKGLGIQCLWPRGFGVKGL